MKFTELLYSQNWETKFITQNGNTANFLTFGYEIIRLEYTFKGLSKILYCVCSPNDRVKLTFIISFFIVYGQPHSSTTILGMSLLITSKFGP